MTTETPNPDAEADSLRVLYVDDDRSVAEVVKASLERADEQLCVRTAMTVKSGLEILADGEIDCVVSDYAMPRMNGIAFLETVREDRPELPFFLFTAKGSETVASEAISAGVTDYLRKGTGKDQYLVLANRIRNAVEQTNAIREREAMRKRMELALKVTNSLIFEIDLETDEVTRHGAVERFLPVDNDSVPKKSDFIEHVIHPEDRIGFWEFFADLQKSKNDYDVFEYRTNPRLGPVRWFKGHVYFNSTERIIGLAQDITEQKEREKSLRQYKQSVESSKDLLAAVDENLEYLFANQEYRNYHGLQNVDITKSSLPDVLPEDQFDTVEPKVQKALDGDPVQTEITRVHPEKGERILDVRLFPLKGNGEEIRGVGASMRDITSEKRLQKDLEESKERYKSLFKSIRDAILVADTERKIINCNPAFTDLFGYELSEIEGKHTKYVYESKAEYEEMGAALEGHFDDPRFTHTVKYEKKSGQTFPGETNVFYLRDADDEIEGFIGVIKDVSKRRDRLKQLQIVDRILQHNFHNDINVIQGFAENIEKEGTPPLTTYSKTIRETGTSLLETVDKEREITKLLSDPPPSEKIDVSRTCAQVAARVSSAYPSAEISASYSEKAVLQTTVSIERAIEELLTNSIIHAGSEQPRVNLIVDTTGSEVIVKVIDENQRIPEMERKVLTGEKELRPLYHGSGMGLWLVTLIVNYSEATLEFEEKDPRGNIVTIRIPARERE